MFRSLRSRLLLSYLSIVVILAIVFVLALLANTSLSLQARARWAAFEMSAVSGTILPEVQRAWVQSAQGGGNARQTFARRMDELADNSGVRLIWVQRATSQVIYDTGGTWEGADWQQRLSAEITDTPSGRTSAIQDADGVTWILFLPNQPPNTRWAFVLAKQPTNPLRNIRAQFGAVLMRSLIVAVPTAILLAYLMSRSVAKPLQRMADAAQGIADGDYDQQLPLSGPSEVQAVATNFNQMARQVKASQTAQRDFVANVSHDLKTPITSIQGWSQALLDGTIDDAALVEKSAEIINTEADRMARMVSHLLEVAKLDAGQFSLNKQSVNLRNLLDEVVANLALKAERKQIKVQFRQTEVELISADSDRLTQIFTNLLDNAITHTASGGTITLKLWQEPNVAAVAVEDTGKGISPADLERIFERFYQADKSRARTAAQQGTGLGLAIVRELVEAHNGTITATSQLGLGSTFTVRLPKG